MVGGPIVGPVRLPHDAPGVMDPDPQSVRIRVGFWAMNGASGKAAVPWRRDVPI